MDRSASNYLSSSSATPLLKTFNLERFHSGMWLAGYPWQYICTATYRNKLGLAKAESSFLLFIDRFRRELAKLADVRGRFPIAWAAVMERRTAGLEMPAIAAHWHFVFAVPPWLQCKARTVAQLHWTFSNGAIEIAAYDPRRGGTYYLAKLVGNSDFPICFDENLDRLTYTGPADLFIAQQTDPNVPDHFKHATSGETLVMRPD